MLLLLVVFTSLSGCSESESTLDDAINLSRDGLSLIKQSQDEQLSEEQQAKLLNDGNEKLTQSKAVYQALILDSPNNGMYHNNHGWLQMKTGDLEGAKSSFEQASQYKDTVKPQGALEKNMDELNVLLEN